MVLFKWLTKIKSVVNSYFTFQYGSIQIFTPSHYLKLASHFYIPIWFYSNSILSAASYEDSLFTFQYGSIQIRQWPPYHFRRLFLHSNMVLFKLRLFGNQCMTSTFTFQYGSIQIISFNLNLLPFLFLHSNMVLFKWLFCDCSLEHCLFYIPIWFYSNKDIFKIKGVNLNFTFQYGSIQMQAPLCRFDLKCFFLHSNMVLFKL